MPYILGDMIRVVPHCTAGDQTSVNVLHFFCSGNAGTGATEQLTASFFSALLAPLYQPLLSSQASFYGVSVAKVIPATGLGYTSKAGAGTGTGGTVLMPRQCAGMITLRSLLPGRRNRGRVYVPFPATTAATSAGAPTTTYKNDLDALATGLLASGSSGTGGNISDWNWCVYSRVDGAFIPVNTFTSQPKFATVRSRGSYGRPNAPGF